MTSGIIVFIILNGFGFLLLNQSMKIRRKAKLAKSWPTIQGVVLESEVEESRRRTAVGKASIGYYPAVTYQYNVLGQSYTGDRVTFGDADYDYITASNLLSAFPVDGEVKVYYNPDNPSESVLAPKTLVGVMSRIPGFFLITLGVAIGLYTVFSNIP